MPSRRTSKAPGASPRRAGEAEQIVGVDLFCGAGGLAYGLRQAGIRIAAGFDLDSKAAFAFERNNPGSVFVNGDLTHTPTADVARFLPNPTVRLLAGCAPCEPFSKYTQRMKNHPGWGLLHRFGRFVEEIKPELVTMENVAELSERGRPVFNRFLSVLDHCGYWVDWRVVHCVEYGVPQTRWRLVLLASRLGPIGVPDGSCRDSQTWPTVRQTIGELPPVPSGGEDPNDPLHVAARLSPANLERLRFTPHDGGTRHAWPEHLVLPCHQKSTGKRYHSIYGRMWWDQPAPTMTTLCTGIGNGRFGHPEQDRAITLREAALFQSFPRNYKFWPVDQDLNRSAVGRLIGNAVPPKLAKALGRALVAHVHEIKTSLRSNSAT